MGRLPRTCLTVPAVAVTLAAAVLLASGAGAAPAAVNLGTADSFAVLGGRTVTNTGPSVISGSLGVSPGSAVTGFPPGIVLNGAIHAADAVALQAQNDLTLAYNTTAGRPCLTDLTGQNLGGLTLTAGVYCFSSSAQLTGTLTLDGQGNPDAEFIFKAGSTLTTASASSVLVINQAQPCHVFHQVGSSATLGTGSQFVGTIMALTSVTATTGVSVQGRLLARNGAVTLDSNTVTRPTCLLTPSSVASTATTTAGTATTRSTTPALTVATSPGRGSSAVTTTTKAPATSTRGRLPSTGGSPARPLAAGLLAVVAGTLILCGPRLRGARPLRRSESSP